MGGLKHFFKSSTITADEHQEEIIQELRSREIEATRDIFGPLPADSKRDFFCLDSQTWIWYEEWVDKHGLRNYMTTRYRVGENEILKSQNGGDYQRLNKQEMTNLLAAAKSYYKKVSTKLYSHVSAE